MADSELRILIVHGQNSFRRMLSRMLTNSGVKVVHQASDVAAAKNIMLSLPVDLILCDWNSQGVDGMDFLRRIRSSDVTKFLPFLLMSEIGLMEGNDFAAGKDFDVDGFIFKPVNQDDLQDKVQSTIKLHQSIREEITHLSRAGAFVDIEMYDEAMGELKTVQEKKPTLPRVWTDTGLLYGSMDSTEEAKSCFQKAISIDKDYAKSYESLGDLLWKEGDLEMAGQFYEFATSISPRNTERQFSLAKLYLETGNTDGAQSALHHALEGEESVGARSAAAAEFFLSSGRPDMAEKEYAFAIEMNPNNIKYYNRLGIAFRQQKKWKEAMDVYKKALNVSPKNTILFYNMARCLAEEGKFTQAGTALKHALIINPKFKEAQNFLDRLNKRALTTA